jgi:hypothetical protein
MADNKRNPANKDSTLFKRLTRLFSGPIVDYRIQNVRRDRRRRLDKYASKFKSASGLQFKKKAYNPYENLMSNRMINQARAERYQDFDQMEYTPELASALDIYADEITTFNSYEELVKIDCNNEEIKEILHALFYKVLNIEFNLFGWTRTMCKYGDYFMYLDIDDEMGVTSVIGLPCEEVERLEGEDKTNPNYVQFQWNSGGLTFENWQMAHFRILGNDKHVPYGTGVLDPGRRIWRQLVLIEDAMLAYRIVRAPDRRAFYVDVGGIPPEEVEQFMQKVMTQMKRHQVVDPETGRVDLRYNPASIEEDYYIPVRGGTAGTRIETVGGQTRINDIEDVKYLRDKLFAAIKIPSAYISRGIDATPEDKTTLAQKDIRFARTITRLQRSVISEIEKIGIIHLYTLGYRGDDLLSFTLSLHNPSQIAQLQELENLRVKLEISTAAMTGPFSQRWIAQNIFGMSEEELLRNQREKFYDKKLEAAYAKVAEAAVGGETGLGGGFGIGATPVAGEELGLGEEFGAPTAELGAPDAEIAPAAGEPPIVAPPAAGEPGADAGPLPGPGETALLAKPTTAPGKRDEEWVAVRRSVINDLETTTAKSKGKWHKPTPQGLDKRKNMAPRRKSMKSMGGHQQGGRRKTHKGYQELNRLGRGIVTESKLQQVANLAERELFIVNEEFNDLIESLEVKIDENES